MGRIRLRCKCGWHIFMSELTEATETTCPSCDKAIPIPGQRTMMNEGRRPAFAGLLQQQWKIAILSLCFVAVAATVSILFIITRSGSGASSGEGSTDKPRPHPPEKEAGKRAPERKEPSPPPPPTPPSTSPAASLSELRGKLAHLLMKQDVGCITAEVLRLRDDREAHDAVVTKTRELHKKTSEVLQQMAAQGAVSKIRSHLLPGDRFITFEGRPLSTLPYQHQAVLLENWLRTYHAGIMTHCTVKRNSIDVEVKIFMPGRSPEILQLAMEAGLLTGEAPIIEEPGKPEPSPQPPHPAPREMGLKAIPKEIEDAIRKRFDALPGGYLKLLPREELQRMQEILEKREGFHEDIFFLRERILGEVLPCIEEEAAHLQNMTKMLEPEAFKVVVTHIVIFKDGRRIEGKVEEESTGKIRIRRPFGSISISPEKILRIERDVSREGEFAARYKAAEGNPQALAVLMQWCRKNRFKPQTKFLAHLILTLAPLHESARKAAEVPLPKLTPPQKNPVDKTESLEHMLEALATKYSKITSFGYVIREIRTRTAGFRHPLPYEFPLEYAEIKRLVKDPRTFTFYNLHPDTALYFQNWWLKLEIPGKIRFIKAYGMWCASR